MSATAFGTEPSNDHVGLEWGLWHRPKIWFAPVPKNEGLSKGTALEAQVMMFRL